MIKVTYIKDTGRIVLLSQIPTGIPFTARTEDAESCGKLHLFLKVGDKVVRLDNPAMGWWTSSTMKFHEYREREIEITVKD